MEDVVEERRVHRRTLLGHCSALALASLATGFESAAQTLAPVRTATILVVGDSLSAEYGLARGSGWVALLEQRLARDKIAAKVVNASISGDTTSGGRSRLPALLKQHRPTHVILELGANDALRGLPIAMTQTNLAEMTRTARADAAQVLVVGMRLPPNYGKKYSDDFAALFATVAKTQGAVLVPYLLKGVADVADYETLFQADRIHPNQRAQATILDNVWASLRPLLR